jgi:hypothetical protein
MNKSHLRTIAEGLNLLFISIILMVFVIVPTVGRIAGLLTLCLSVYALSTMKAYHVKFRNAFFATIAALILGMLSFVPFLGGLLTVRDIANLVSAYMVCGALDDIMRQYCKPQFPTGAFVWKLLLLYTILSAMLTFVRLPEPLAILILILSPVLLIFYMMLLYKSSKALAAATRK